MSSPEFLPKPFSKSVSPPMSDSSDKEHPKTEDQAEAEENHEDKTNQQFRDVPEQVAARNQLTPNARASRVDSTGSSSAHSHSPKSSHESSEFSGSGSEVHSSYKLSKECTSRHKGRKKKTSGGQTLVPSGTEVEGRKEGLLSYKLRH